MTIQITLDDAEINAALNNLVRHINNLQPAMNDIGEALVGLIQEQLGRGETPWGDAFEPLSAAYIDAVPRRAGGIPLNNGYRCRCSIRSLSEHQAKARSGPGKGLNNPALLEDGTPALPDKGWDYNPSDRLAGVNKALMDKRGKSSHVLLQALVDKLKKIPEFDIISGMDTLQKDYEKWAKQVLQPDYKARHEFRQVGVLPDFVMADESVKALNPQSDTIEISDYLLRHGQRPNKLGRQASLSLEDLIKLPYKIALSDWVYDAQHKNIIGFFDISHAKNIGKAVVTFNYDRKGVLHNAVVTTGVVGKIDAKSEWYREIKK